MNTAGAGGKQKLSIISLSLNRRYDLRTGQDDATVVGGRKAAEEVAMLNKY